MRFKLWMMSVFFLFSCAGRKGNYLADGTLPVWVEPVSVELREMTLTYPMTLIPSDKTEIALPEEFKIGKVFILAGDKVQAGDPLFEMDESEIAVKLAQLKLQRNEQEAAVEKSSFYYRNKDPFLREGKIDKLQYEGLEAEVENAEATLQKTKGDISLLENQMKQTTLTSPIAGVVTAKNVSAGSIAAARQTLVTIIRFDPIQAAFEVPAEQSGFVSKETQVEITLAELPDPILTGTVSYVEPEVDPSTKTFTAWVSLPNPEAVLKAGMSGTVRWISPERVRTVVIPKEAVLKEEGKPFVFVVRNNRTFRVRIFPRQEEESPIEVTQGLTEADLIVVRGKEQLKDGMRMEIWK